MAGTALTDLFRQRIRAVGPLDAHMLHCLDVAEAWVVDRVYAVPDADPATRHADVTEAILILAHRLFTRRNSPEGVAGWGDLGVIRVAPNDPDIRALLEAHIDHTKVGIA
jgi:hypothetical protein